ncbi:MAG: hypothetical protein GF411_09760 [Candidatus Lokiarchaeota archaeon]|nr:hypothetical protein [Candidatus Lokiarchaeota archaeon]
MSDPQERLRDKTRQITALQQKVGSLEAQLSGAHRRAHKLNESVQTLERTIAEKDSEIRMLRSELEKTKGALDTVGAEIRGMKAEQVASMSKQRPGGAEYSMKEKLETAERRVAAMKDDMKLLSEAATDVLNQEPGAIDSLRDAVLAVGDPKFKILNIVLNRRSVRIDEIASTLVIDVSEALRILDELQSAGEVELREGTTAIPGKKYREVKIPAEEWKTWEPSDIFDNLEDIVEKAEGTENIVKALETAVDILETKMARGGALIFQMRRTAGAWRKKEGDREELKYTIREWKGRAEALA